MPFGVPKENLSLVVIDSEKNQCCSPAQCTASSHMLGLAMKNQLPFLSLSASLTLLRFGVAGLYMAHAVVRIANGSIQQFADYMAQLGFAQALAIVWAITAFEILGGVLLMLNIKTPQVAAGFFAIALGGIVLIHRHFGWFVGEHGTGGSEYSVCLMLALVVIVAYDQDQDRPPLRTTPSPSL